MTDGGCKDLGSASSTLKGHHIADNSLAEDASFFGLPNKWRQLQSTVCETGQEALRSHAFIHLTSGAVAGGFSRTATAPLDRIKLVMQLSYSTNRLTLWNTIKIIYGEPGSLHTGVLGLGSRGGVGGGGILSFFRGNGTNCVKIAPETAIKFFTYDLFKRSFIGATEEESSKTGNEADSFSLVLKKLVCGGCAGATSQLIVYPMEVVKTRLASCPPNLYRGITHCIISTWRTEGGRALYRGLTPSLIGIFPYAGIDLAAFETFKHAYMVYHRLDRVSATVPTHILFVCGAMSSALGQIVAYPIGLLRTRMQADGMGGKPRRYTSLFGAFCKTLKEEGPTGFYKGIGPNLLKAVPAVSISWVIYENCKGYLTGIVK